MRTHAQQLEAGPRLLVDGEEVREELQRDMKTPWGVMGVFTQLVTVL